MSALEESCSYKTERKSVAYHGRSAVAPVGPSPSGSLKQVAVVVINYLPRGQNEKDARGVLDSLSTQAMIVAGEASHRRDVEGMMAEVAAKFGRPEYSL